MYIVQGDGADKKLGDADNGVVTIKDQVKHNLDRCTGVQHWRKRTLIRIHWYLSLLFLFVLNNVVHYLHEIQREEGKVNFLHTYYTFLILLAKVNNCLG